MHVVRHAHLIAQRHGGETRLAAADQQLDVQAFEVWTWRLDPGAHSAEQ